MKYAVVIEKGSESYGAYAPDLPGCGVAGNTREEVIELIAEAIRLHLDALCDPGLEAPTPSSIEIVEIAA